MSSWGTTDVPASKPRFLTDAEKLNCAANESGWTVPAGGNNNPNADRETLVAIGELASALAIAEIKSFNFSPSALSAADTALSVYVNYNETVILDVTGGAPTLNVTNGGEVIVLTYVSGSRSNRLVFSNSAITVVAADVLTIGANSIVIPENSALAGSDGGVAEITHVAPANTITVAA